MAALISPVFPLRITYETGEHEDFANEVDLAQDLEHFDSERALGCEVTDALGKPVRLVVDLLEVKRLEVKGE